ncbi:RNA polymerase I specific transcription initiation factor RRN3 domain-containing protein [Sarocladium implicatum]|nr:RNA polymerase I specific transcription initiation factor RRN3 domain-containing protein [Sarocladium implicatum]
MPMATSALRGPSGIASPSATPVKSILKPSSVLGRRTANDADLDDATAPAENPSKRRKVIFDDVKNVTYEVKGRTMDDVKREVRRALEDHMRGDDSQYDILKEMFSRDKSGDESQDDHDGSRTQELQAYVVALTSSITILKDKNCNGLIRQILESSWLGRDEAYVKSFRHLLAALVSAHGSYLLPILGMLVEKFQDHKSSSWLVADMPDITRDTMRDRLHGTVQYILQMFPAAVRVLENLITSKFPFQDDDMPTHMAYIHNLLRLKEYVPSLEDEILDLILDRVVKIDSQMQVDLEDTDDDITAAVMYALQERPEHLKSWEDDEDADESDTESVDSDDPDYDRDAARIKSVKSSVEKMDAVLDTLFTYHTPAFADPGSDQAFVAFTTLLREFDHLVLPTYQSRHTQFLIFHFAQQHERLTDAFCGQLIATAFQSNTPNVLKQAAAAYLASFVARGAHVPGSLVRTIFVLLIHHLEQYRRKYEPVCRGPDLKRFHPYYSLLQATLYIFCFRWQDLVISAPETVDADDPASYIGQELEWIGTSKKDLSVQIFGKLNPLKVCAPVIVEEFAKLAHRLNFMYVYPLVESNKRVRLTQFLSATYATGGALRDAGYDAQDESFHQLDPYFPFDPYQLPVSKRWLENDYVHWKAIPGLNAEEEDEDDSSDEGEDDGDDDEEIEEETATDSEEER